MNSIKFTSLFLMVLMMFNSCDDNEIDPDIVPNDKVGKLKKINYTLGGSEVVGTSFFQYKNGLLDFVTTEWVRDELSVDTIFTTYDSQSRIINYESIDYELGELYRRVGEDYTYSDSDTLYSTSHYYRYIDGIPEYNTLRTYSYTKISDSDVEVSKVGGLINRSYVKSYENGNLINYMFNGECFAGCKFSYSYDTKMNPFAGLPALDWLMVWATEYERSEKIGPNNILTIIDMADNVIFNFSYEFIGDKVTKISFEQNGSIQGREFEYYE